MKKILTVVVVLLLLSGCYEQVPAGYKGKIRATEGFQPEIYPPSRVWLETFFPGNNDKLYLIETTTEPFKETIPVLLKDKLTVSVDVKVRGRIMNNDRNINITFNDIPLIPEKLAGWDYEYGGIVKVSKVYGTYIKLLVRNISRDIISEYNTDEFSKNYKRITAQLKKDLLVKSKLTPFRIEEVVLGEVKYPSVVTDAIEEAKKRRLQIEREEAQVQIELEKLKGREEIAKGENRIKLLEAERISQYNEITNKGITPQLLELRKLEIQQKLVEALSGNSNVIYMPHGFFEKVNPMLKVK